METLNNVNIDVVDNGYVINTSSRDSHGNYKNTRLVFLDRQDMYDYLTSLGL